MKRPILSLLLVLCLTLTVCAGAASASPSASTPDPSPSASTPAEPTPAATAPVDPTVYSYRTLPSVPLPEVEIRRVDVGSVAVGGSDGVVDPDDLREVLSLLEQIPIYDQPMDPYAAQRLDDNGRGWRYDFYASPEDGTPVYSLTIHPCRITVGDETYGPFVMGEMDKENYLPYQISGIAHPTVPKEHRRTIAEVLGRPLPEGELTVCAVAGPHGEERFTPAPETAAAIREALDGQVYYTLWDISRQGLPWSYPYRLEFAVPGEDPIILWIEEGSIIPEGTSCPEYRPYNREGNDPLLALLSEATGLEPFPSTLSFLQSQAMELYVLRFETDDPASLETQRAFLSWWFDGSIDLAQYAAQGEIRFPLKEMRDVARWRLGVEDFDPLTVFADRLDQPGRWTWYDTANQEYVVEQFGGYGGAAALAPLERELTRNEAGELVSLRLLIGAFDPNLYYHQDPPEYQLIGRYEVRYDFPGGESKNWRLVSAKREDL